MLIGQYESKISIKFQTSLPKRFREVLGDKLIITKGFENCLIVVSEENWKTLLEGTEGKPFTDKSTREIQRFLLGNASYVTLDAKGRYIIPEFLRNYASLKEDIVYSGIQKFVEVWDKVNWDKHQEELSRNIETIADKLSGKTE